MDVKRGSEPATMKNRTTVERKSERELLDELLVTLGASVGPS